MLDSNTCWINWQCNVLCFQHSREKNSNHCWHWLNDVTVPIFQTIRTKTYMKFNHDTMKMCRPTFYANAIHSAAAALCSSSYLLIHIFHKFIRRRIAHKSKVSFCMDCKNNGRQISTTFNNTNIIHMYCESFLNILVDGWWWQSGGGSGGFGCGGCCHGAQQHFGTLCVFFLVHISLINS